MADLADATVDDDGVKADIKEIDELNALTQGQGLSWKEFFSNGREMNGWRASVACASQACQQITGSTYLLLIVHPRSRITVLIIFSSQSGHLLRHYCFRNQLGI